MANEERKRTQTKQGTFCSYVYSFLFGVQSLLELFDRALVHPHRIVAILVALCLWIVDLGFGIGQHRLVCVWLLIGFVWVSRLSLLGEKIRMQTNKTHLPLTWVSIESAADASILLLSRGGLVSTGGEHFCARMLDKMSKSFFLHFSRLMARNFFFHLLFRSLLAIATIYYIYSYFLSKQQLSKGII